MVLTANRRANPAFEDDAFDNLHTLAGPQPLSPKQPPTPATANGSAAPTSPFANSTPKSEGGTPTFANGSIGGNSAMGSPTKEEIQPGSPLGRAPVPLTPAASAPAAPGSASSPARPPLMGPLASLSTSPSREPLAAGMPDSAADAPAGPDDSGRGGLQVQPGKDGASPHITLVDPWTRAKRRLERMDFKVRGFVVVVGLQVFVCRFWNRKFASLLKSVWHGGLLIECISS